MIRKLLVITLSLSLLASQAVAQRSGQQAPGGTKPRKLKVHRHTGLKFNLVQPLSSATAKPGDDVPLKLADPLVVDGVTVLQAGEVVNAKVVKVKKAGPNCKTNGEVQWQLDHLTMPDGTLVRTSIKLAAADPGMKVPDKFSPWKKAFGDTWWEAILSVPAYALIIIGYAVVLPLAPIILLAYAASSCPAPGIEFQLPAGSTVGVEITENHTVHY